ncbi:MAG: hypothetical protein ACAH80_05945 [Alphaproteobacteria bacterium]
MAHRPLTPGEIALAKLIFKDSIDYSAVRLHDKRILPSFIQEKHQAVAHRSSISFPRSAYAEDFSKEPDALKQSVFIHELVHVWQHQNKVLSTPREGVKETLRHRFNYSKAYLHKLATGKDLVNYGFEQQAAIVQDYFLLKHRGIDKSYKGRRLEKPADLLEKYEAVLGNFLKEPSYAKGLHKKRHKQPPAPK